ncbi:MAG TPA: PQQ-binding-like beta-propeller repeat protein [Candidatus Paceibacterota bacterium]|nr:PQQ-binding-like beta-propeller repeat protein [Candidatus Paceibacterota bacterium]
MNTLPSPPTRVPLALVLFLLVVGTFRPFLAQGALTNLWESHLGSDVFAAPALAPNGRIYASATVGEGAKLLAINPDGTTSWSFRVGGVIYAAPAVGPDSRVYVGDYTGTFFAVSSDGTEAWRFSAGGRILSSAAVTSEGRVFFGATDGRLYALAAGGTLEWAFATGGEIGSSPAVAGDGTIVFGSADTYVYGLRPDGSQKWRFAAGAEVWSSPAIGADGTIYIGSDNGKLHALTPAGTLRWVDTAADPFGYLSPVIGKDGVIYANSGGRLTALDPAGARLREVVDGGFLGTPAAAADGTVFIRGAGYRLRSFGSGGQVVEDLGFGWGHSGVLLGGNGRLVATSQDGWLVCYTGAPDPASSSWPQFRRDARRSGVADPAPTVNLVLPAQDMSFRAGQPVPLWADVAHFGPDAAVEFLVDGEVVATVTAPFRATWEPTTAGVRSVVARAFDSEGTAAVSGAVSVTILPAGANAFPEVWIESPANGAALGADSSIEVRAVAHDRDGVVTRLEFFADGVAFAETEFPNNTASWQGFGLGLHELVVVAVDNAGARSTSAVHRITVLARPWSRLFTEGVRSPQAAGSDGTVYVVSAAGALQALSATGQTNWVFVTDEGNSSAAPAVATDGTIYFATYAGKLHAVRADGVPLWAFTAGQRIWSSPAIGRDGTIYFGCENRRLYAVRPDGVEKWAFEAEFYISSSPAVADNGTVYFGSDGGTFYAVGPDGTLAWQVAVPPGVNSSPALGADGTVYFGAANSGDVYALLPDGSIKWTATLPEPIGDASPVLAQDGTVYLASGTRLYALRPEDGQVRWSFGATGEIFATPVVAADGTVLFGDIGRRFHALAPDGTPRWELALEGKVTQPALLTAGGLLVFPTDDNQLHAVTISLPPALSAWPQFHRHPERTGLGMARPVVRLVQPETDVNIALGDTVSLVAEASSPNGALTRVEFLEGTHVIATVAAGPPFGVDWVPARTGRLRLTARATDVAGASAVSAANTIWVFDPAAPPVISEHPTSVTVTNGMTVTLSVCAHGAPPLEMQWLKDGRPLMGATATVLELPDATPADSGHYQARVQNARGTTTSAAALVTVIQPPSVRWVARGSSPARHAPAIGRGGLLYYGGQTAWLTCMDPRAVFEWDCQAGGEIWSAVTLAEDGTIYFGARDRNLYALNPDGGLRWRFATPYVVDASPALGSDGTIYCASADGAVFAVSPEGSQRWRFDAVGEVYSSPCVAADGTIYVISFGLLIPGTDTYSGRLYALRPDGRVDWEYLVNERVSGSPAVGADGTVYFGTPGGRFLAVTPDGTFGWEIETGGAFFENEPVIGPEGVVLIGQEWAEPGTGTKRGRFLAINPDGTVRWSYATGAPIYSTAAATADGTVYFTDESRTLYGLNANGTLRFTYAADFARGASPALGYDGTIYVADGLLALHALLGHSPPAQSSWPMARRDLRHTANAGTPPDAETWFYPFNSNAFDDEVRTIALDGANVYVGGAFKLAGGLPSRFVARWDGAAWSALGAGFDAPVSTLTMFRGQLHAGGHFSRADGQPVGFLARWNGLAWESLGSGVNDLVEVLLAVGDDLYVAGSFSTAGGVTARNIARWDGTAWSALGEGVGAAVLALASDGTRLFVGGANNLSHGELQLGMVAQWDGQQWRRVGVTGPQGTVRALAWHRGHLYAAGDFALADNQPARGIAMFDGTAWTEVAGGLSDPLSPYGYALASDGQSLWVGGTFTRAGTVAASRIARWDGAQWHPLGLGVDRRSGTSATVVRALAAHDGEVLVGGTFLAADGNRTNRQFARWRPEGWSSLGPALGFVDGRFSLALQSDRGLTYGIEASDDLVTWTRLVTFTNLTQAVRFLDEQSASRSHRFYRAVSP